MMNSFHILMTTWENHWLDCLEYTVILSIPLPHSDQIWIEYKVHLADKGQTDLPINSSVQTTLKNVRQPIIDAVCLDSLDNT